MAILFRSKNFCNLYLNVLNHQIQNSGGSGSNRIVTSNKTLSSIFLLIRKNFYSSMSEKRGLVLGAYCNESSNDVKLTPFAQKFNDSTSGELLKQINAIGPIKGGCTRIFWNLGNYPAVAVAGLGDASSWDDNEGINGSKENVRIAAAAGAKALLSEKIIDIDMESFECAQSAAEGSALGVYKYQMYRLPDKRTPEAKLKFIETNCGYDDAWNVGSILGEAQNWSRILKETPANLMTPTIFGNTVKTKLSEFGVDVIEHDRNWAEKQKMGSYLSVSRGSIEPPVFLEITYNGAPNDKNQPICLIGKGITFDSGGISLKPSSKMDQMRADMGGAACVSATIYALAKLQIPVNVKGLIPLCENLPSGMATKPGDVVYAMNGKSICVDNTDAEGRLVLCDAILYSEKFKPKYILDIATLTGAISVALGDCVAGAYSNNNQLWNLLQKSGCETGDRMWRMPLYKHYTKMMTDYTGYDLNNLSRTSGGGSCSAAAFLREFVPKNTPWVHIDMAGIMGNTTDQSYVGKSGMTGRPTRTLFEFVLREAGILKN